jgi:integrase
MAKRHLRLVFPATVNRTVRPRRRPNGDLRTREYLTEAEVERLMKAATRNRWGHRDSTMVLVAYRHGLRASEVVDLRWDQIEFKTANLHVRRVKQGTPSTHPSSVTNCAPCGGSSANRSLSRHSYSPPSAARHLARPDSRA